MNKEQMDLISKALKVVKDCEAVEGMPLSTSKELIVLLNELCVT